jgi:hypothetical protein
MTDKIPLLVELANEETDETRLQEPVNELHPSPDFQAEKLAFMLRR